MAHVRCLLFACLCRCLCRTLTAFLNVFCIFKFVFVASEGQYLLRAHVVGIYMALIVER